MRHAPDFFLSKRRSAMRMTALIMVLIVFLLVPVPLNSHLAGAVKTTYGLGSGITLLQPTESDRGFGPGQPNSADIQSTAISVPYCPQIETYYCAEASLEMILDHYGPDISQYEIANVARAESGLVTFTGDMRALQALGDFLNSF